MAPFWHCALRSEANRMLSRARRCAAREPGGLPDRTRHPKPLSPAPYGAKGVRGYREKIKSSMLTAGPHGKATCYSLRRLWSDARQHSLSNAARLGISSRIPREGFDLSKGRRCHDNPLVKGPHHLLRHAACFSRPKACLCRTMPPISGLLTADRQQASLGRGEPGPPW
jgi:hypothetical protein